MARGLNFQFSYLRQGSGGQAISNSQTMSEFIVKTEKFEGPIELLLDLIESRKLAINEVTLSEVADDFMGYTKENGGLSLEDTTNFVIIASTLLLIKSMSLLPGFELSAEEEESVSDLKRRLATYQVIKDIAVQIKNNYGRQVIFFRQAETNETIPVFSPADDLTLVNLAEAARALIADLPKKETLPETEVKKVISLEEMIEKLTERIKKNIEMKFSEFTDINREKKIIIILSFLALLELVKRGALAASQQGHFSEIELKTLQHGGN